MNSAPPCESWPAPASSPRACNPSRVRTATTSATLFALALLSLSFAQAANPTSLGTSAVGVAAAQNVTVPVTVSGTVASVAVLTAGSPNLDFTETAPGDDTCAGHAFMAPGSCTVNVTFSPLYPGPRVGAVVLEDSAGNTLGSEYLTGMGQGPLAVMVPGTISTIAGQLDQWTQINDGQPATQADLYLPFGVAVDGAGDLFIADTKHNRVREVVASTGDIITVAGNGNPGYDPAETVAVNATLTLPGGVALDGAGNLYIADTDNNEILEVDLTTGAIVGRWGNGQAGYAGDGLAPNASTTEFNAPGGVTLDASGNIYIADTGNNRIREINAATGLIGTIAGGGSTPGACTGSTDALGDGCAATSAILSSPYAVAFDPAGNMYVPDSGDNVIRRVDSSSIITTYAGDGTAGFSGDGGPAAAAELYSPLSVACDAAGNLYIADARNYVVRKVSSATLTISTIAGNNDNNTFNDGKSGYTYGTGQNGEAYSGNGIATAGPSPKVVGAGIYAPYSVAVDAAGNLYIAEYFDNLVRKVTANDATLFFTPAKWVGQVSSPESQTLENDGNQALSFTAISSDANSTVSSGGSCSTTGTVAVDGQCDVQVEFSPTTSNNPLVANVTLKTQPNASLTIAAVGQALAQNNPQVSVASLLNPSNYGQNVTFTVSVAKSPGSTQGTPTGTVNLYDLFPAPKTPPVVGNPPTPPPGVLIGTATLGANGSVNIVAANLAVGLHDIYASYGGDTYYVAANSATPLVQQVNEQVGVTLSNTSGNNPATYNTSVTFTATVSVSGNVSTAGTSVMFYGNSGYLGTAPLNASNSAVFTLSSLPPGDNSITATYTDVNNASGSSAPYNQSVRQTTTTTVASSATGNQSAYGSAVSFTATVAATGPLAPGGTVTFHDGTTQLGTVNLTTGAGTSASGTLTISTLGVGAHSITATYNPDANDFTSTSAGYPFSVSATTTATTLRSSANPGIAGGAVSFTAKVASSGGNVPTGTVNFYNGATLIGAGTLNGSGVASLTTSILPIGSYAVSAKYLGDSNDGASTSSSLAFSIIQATTQTRLAASAPAINVTTPITFTATLTGNGGIPTGVVSFMDGTVTLGTARLNGSGIATLTTTALPAGQQSITAIYQGDTNDAASTSGAVTVSVGTFSTQTNLAASAMNVGSTQPVVLLATVISASGRPVAGTVTFLEGATTLGTATIGANGSASISLTLAAGTDTIIAQYSGDADDAGSKSSSVVISVGQATDFNIQLSPTSLTIPTGNYANVSISLASLKGFADDIALGCGSLPPSVTCNFSTTSTSLSANGNASVQLTVDTNSPLISGSQARNHLPASPGSNGGTILAAFLLPGAGLLTLWRFRRRSGVLRVIAILAVVGGATLAMNGCGGLSLSSAKPGSYVIQVTATGKQTKMTHVANLTVQVTQ